MDVERDGKNILVKGVTNGKPVPLKDIGLPEDVQIRRLWTVLDEESLFTAFNPQTGEKYKVTLSNATPRHWVNAFIEDRMHDWWILNGHLRYEAHSSEKGKEVTLLIQL